MADNPGHEVGGKDVTKLIITFMAFTSDPVSEKFYCNGNRLEITLTLGEPVTILAQKM